MNPEKIGSDVNQDQSSQLEDQTKRNHPVITRTLKNVRELKQEKGELDQELKEELVRAKELIDELLGE